MTDVVYVLGTGSGWNNNELRFSLRSIEKNGINIGKLFVVGTRPEFLTADVIHIHADDIYLPNVNADGNIAHKVMTACADDRLSDDFLFINDDHLILKPIDLLQIPAFHKGDMNTYDECYFGLNYWRGRLKRTMQALNDRQLSALHFDCHTPIIFNKKRFCEVMASFPIGEGIGLTMKSLYGNCVYESSGVLLCDQKRTVFKKFTEEQLAVRLSDCGFMSFNDDGLTKALKCWLYTNFPAPSRWEKDNVKDKHIEILNWLESDRDYQTGVRIFEKYIHGVNLIKMFRSGETQSLRKKLEYKLKQSITE
jgi:hypothetical protein